MAVTTSVAVLVAASSILGLTVGLRRWRRGFPGHPRPTAHAVRRDPVKALATVLRERRWARRMLSLLSVALLLGAVGVLGYPFYTNLYQGRVQERLDRQFSSPELEEAYRDRRVGTGDALTRLKMPAIDVDVVVVEGTTASALRAGAGHFPSTVLPCEAGNVGIAGHRTTYGRPFHNIDKLGPGDVITLETPIGSCVYELREAPFVVDPTDVWVVDPTPTAMVTLATCEPKGSAAKRLIVRAELVSAASA